MAVYLLPEEPVFPPVNEAEPDGLVAIGGDLSPTRLLSAYASGIFPWFMEEEDIFWFSPDPRMILLPENFKVSDSFHRIIHSNHYEVRFDTVFDQVIGACAEMVRPGQDGTWIGPAFIEAYQRLYDMGYAHSVETFKNNTLVGGLYGIAIGAAFFGESMFFRTDNASKIALHRLVERCREFGIHFIDCQVESEHLSRLGAHAIPREAYLERLAVAMKSNRNKGRW